MKRAVKVPIQRRDPQETIAILTEKLGLMTAAHIEEKQKNIDNAQAYARDIAAADEHMRKAWARTRELEDMLLNWDSGNPGATRVLRDELMRIRRVRVAEDPMRVESVWAERERRNGGKS